VPATVVVGAQWGDEGKGKIVDLLAQEADVVCRYQGGPNAGHTIVAGGETFKIRQTPSGVISGKTSVIGAGCVVDPQVLLDELAELESRGIDVSVVVVSGNAHLIMPWHVAIDQASERRLGHLQIGTTRRGIGPAYADKASRLGIRVQDVLDPKILRQKIEVALAEKNLWLERIYEAEPFVLEEVWEQYAGLAERLAPYVGDVSLLVDRALRDGKEVLFEGAQATLLDLDHGTYPFVTSSNTVAGQAAAGSGLGPKGPGYVLGIVKAYTTRVGEGPFPTELTDEVGRRLGERGHEFGTVTGRARRCGWFDAALVRQSVALNGISGIALTKLDVLDGLATLKICTGYRLGDQAFAYLPAGLKAQAALTPVYEEMEGWRETTQGARSWRDLPANAVKYVRRIEELIGAPVALLSTSPQRDDTILVRDPFQD